MGTFVDCEVIEMTSGLLQPRPKWCDLDWGHRFSMSEFGPAEMGTCVDWFTSIRTAMDVHLSSAGLSKDELDVRLPPNFFVI